MLREQFAAWWHEREPGFRSLGASVDDVAYAAYLAGVDFILAEKVQGIEADIEILRSAILIAIDTEGETTDYNGNEVSNGSG